MNDHPLVSLASGSVNVKTQGPVSSSSGFDEWQSASDLPISVSATSAVGVDGLIYITGGTKDGTSSISDVYEYDPSTDTYTSLPNLKTARHNHGVVSDGTDIYVVGGQDTKTIEKFDISAGSWTTIETLSNVRQNPATCYLNGYIYIFGGRDGSNNVLSSAKRYDISSGTVETLTSYPNKVWAAACEVVNGGIYITGGKDDSATFRDETYLYDPSNDGYSQKANLNNGRRTTSVSTADHFYVIGGFDGSTLDTVEKYYPSSDEWQFEKTLPQGRYNTGLANDSGTLYVFGGRDSGSNFLSSVLRSAGFKTIFTAEDDLIAAVDGDTARVRNESTGTESTGGRVVAQKGDDIAFLTFDNSYLYTVGE